MYFYASKRAYPGIRKRYPEKYQKISAKTPVKPSFADIIVEIKYNQNKWSIYVRFGNY